ncbi:MULTISPECIES: YqeG family HAD IIIA-type phosphatase [unclassified Cyanobium]|uniref:YqeG family HAD IIIA-type phosphatase n=1 Tax=unclassified Cyanobium TaxID=2627006 RepID=UPI0020CB8753|nr:MULTISPECIES: YqeG family HAD IIIA-type phosphatase [unclassified Cyanobium]MCP9859065.1 YqeG family HAD IIIA-type phosphatase [Cyanobium sp. Cruz-8H5]MCP9866331.1 YqeG family HAD IIIA-type phosphatase [Cyanobium sp. Cruz-8D1]
MLRDLLTPDWLPGTSLAHLPLQELVDRGIRALVLDVDRTLLPRRQATMPVQAELWLRHARERMPLHLLSNNPSRRRIGAVADTMGLPYTTSAGKPRRAALRKVLLELDLAPGQVALVGDRLFTDVLVGNRMGLFTVLVKPIDPDGEPCRQDRLQNLELRMARWMGSVPG